MLYILHRSRSALNRKKVTFARIKKLGYYFVIAVMNLARKISCDSYHTLINDGGAVTYLLLKCFSFYLMVVG